MILETTAEVTDKLQYVVPLQKFYLGCSEHPISGPHNCRFAVYTKDPNAQACTEGAYFVGGSCTIGPKRELGLQFDYNGHVTGPVNHRTTLSMTPIATMDPTKSDVEMGEIVDC